MRTLDRLRFNYFPLRKVNAEVHFLELDSIECQVFLGAFVDSFTNLLLRRYLMSILRIIEIRIYHLAFGEHLRDIIEDILQLQGRHDLHLDFLEFRRVGQCSSMQEVVHTACDDLIISNRLRRQSIMQSQILDYLKFSRLKFIFSKTEAKQPVGVVAIEIDKAQW